MESIDDLLAKITQFCNKLSAKGSTRQRSQFSDVVYFTIFLVYYFLFPFLRSTSYNLFLFVLFICTFIFFRYLFTYEFPVGLLTLFLFAPSYP